MKDLKYLLAYTVILASFFSIYFRGLLSFTTLIYAFVCIPILELLLKTRTENYSESDLKRRATERFFDWMLYLNLPLVFVLLYFGLQALSDSTSATYEAVGLIFSLGVLLGTNGINVAHELGHRKTRIEKSMGKLLLLPALYMHFYIEHNFGHHKNVATPQDPATAKKNQMLYSFWWTSVIGQYQNAWRIQAQLLQTNKASFFSIHNDLLFYALFQSAYLITLLLLFGPMGVVHGVSIAVVAVLLLETINYIEHYGLVRKKIKGRYERVQPIHSWNSDHVVGRIVLYELTRHSDHHFRASKKYQLLESKAESPKLPYGYPTSMLLALVPPLWFWLMNKQLSSFNPT